MIAVTQKHTQKQMQYTVYNVYKLMEWSEQMSGRMFQMKSTPVHMYLFIVILPFIYI